MEKHDYSEHKHIKISKKFEEFKKIFVLQNTISILLILFMSNTNRKTVPIQL